MKIVAARLLPFAAQLERAVAAGRTQRIERRGALLVIEDEQGRTGLGELSPLPGFSPDTFDDALVAARKSAERLEGAELADEDLDTLLDTALETAPDEGRGLPVSCLAALETALADLLARRRNVPLHVLLRGGPAPADHSVPLSALLPSGSLQEMIEAAFAAIGRGVRTLKAKPSLGGADIELCSRIEIIRRKIGLDVGLRVDVNGAWTLEDAPYWLEMLATSGGPELCEQPVAPQHLAGLKNPAVPIAADESLMFEQSREEAFTDAPLSAVVLKPMVLGGLRATRSLARRAAAAGLDVIVSHLHSGPVAHAMACELALALDPPPAPCGLDTGPALEALGGPPPQLRAAWIVPVDRPGLGIGRDLLERVPR